MAAGPDPAWVPVATLAGGRAVEPTCGLGYHTCPAIHKALLWRRAGAGRLPFAQCSADQQHRRALRQVRVGTWALTHAHLPWGAGVSPRKPPSSAVTKSSSHAGPPRSTRSQEGGLPLRGSLGGGGRCGVACEAVPVCPSGPHEAGALLALRTRLILFPLLSGLTPVLEGRLDERETPVVSEAVSVKAPRRSPTGSAWHLH